MSLTASGPGDLVDILVVAGMNRSMKRGVDWIDSKCRTAAAVKRKDISIGRAGAIFLSLSLDARLKSC